MAEQGMRNFLHAWIVTKYCYSLLLQVAEGHKSSTLGVLRDVAFAERIDVIYPLKIIRISIAASLVLVKCS